MRQRDQAAHAKARGSRHDRVKRGPTPAEGAGRTRERSGVEVEAKFIVPDEPAFERLLSLETLGEYALVPAGEARAIDRYVDTANRDLLRSGYACRRRSVEESGPELVTVKALGAVRGAVHRRPEVEIEIPREAPPERWPPGPPRDIVRRITGDRPLLELLVLRQHRTTRDVLRRDHRVAVLSLDRIELAPGTTSLELEIELGPGGRGSDLRALSERLGPFGLEPQPLSKFERALTLLDGRTSDLAGDDRGRARPARPASAASGKAAAPAERRRRRAKRMGVQADDPIVEAGRKILRFHWEQALAHESGTIAGSDPEELHDMRVATRRQRAALRIIEPYCRRKAVRPVRDGLRALGGRLGAVRDLDVLLAVTRAHQATLPAAEARAFERLLRDWTRRREDARRRMLDHLAGQAHAVFKEHYTAFLDTPGAGARSEATPRATSVRHILPHEIWAHHGALGAFENVLPWASADTLHELRIRGKRLRYLLEFFREVLGRNVEKPIQALVALQDHLGELQDGVVTSGLVDEFLAGSDARAHAEAAAAAERYREVKKVRIEELRRGLGGPWSGVTDSGFRSCLSRAVAALQRKPAARRSRKGT